MAYVSPTGRQTMLVVVALVCLSLHTAVSHPQCLDSRPPFENKQGLPFCGNYSEFGCCTRQDAQSRFLDYETIRRNTPTEIWTRCSDYVETLLCQSCSPYAAHIFEAEAKAGVYIEVKPRVFPGLCKRYCTEFYNTCKDVMQYYMFDATEERAKLLNASLLGADNFCREAAISDEIYCYPELLTNPILTGNISLPQVTKEGCLCVEKLVDFLRNPIFARHAGDGSNRLFVGEQIGQIHIVYPDGRVENEPFFDISHQVLTSSSRGDERGFLGLAFHPNYNVTGKFYVYFCTVDNLNHHAIRISEFHVSRTNKNLANMSSERILLEIQQPFWNHNGGEIMFGPDNYLYLFVGDGGSGGDPQGNGQNLNSLLGKVLRIDVDTTSVDKPYGIPPDNPYADGVSGRPEIYAYGVRNIWRCDMDNGDPNTATRVGYGRIMCGDVGQNAYEELDMLSYNANYGWNGKEGYHCYDRDVCNTVNADPNYVDPVFAYPHSVGKSVTGGHFYRGCHSPNLNGYYIYGDFMTGRLYRLLENSTTGRWDNKEIQMCGPDKCVPPLQGTYNKKILSFGEDEHGEVYMMSSTEARAKLPLGALYRIVDPARRGNPDNCRSARPHETPSTGTTAAPGIPPTTTTTTTTTRRTTVARKPDFTSAGKGNRLSYLDYYRRKTVNNKLRRNRKQKDENSKPTLKMHGIRVNHCTHYPKFWCSLNRLKG